MIDQIKTFEERKEQIIAKGKEKGFITYEELANELKGLDLDSDSLDDLYNSLVENGIEIVTDEEFSPFEVLSDPHPVNIVPIIATNTAPTINFNLLLLIFIPPLL